MGEAGKCAGSMSGIFAHSPLALAAAAPVGAADVVAAGGVATVAGVAGRAAVVPPPEPVLHAEESRTVATDRTISLPSMSLLTLACGRRALRAASLGMLDAHKLGRLHHGRPRQRHNHLPQHGSLLSIKFRSSSRQGACDTGHEAVMKDPKTDPGEPWRNA